jgi:hypothetical protein
MSQIDEAEIGATLSAIRAEVRARRAPIDATPPDRTVRELADALDEIELYRVVSAHWPLDGRTLPQRLGALVNKVVRRLLRWYINPIVEQQNAYNDAVARALRILADAYRELDEQHATEGGAPPSPASAEDSADAAALQQRVHERGAAEPPVRFVELDLVALAPDLRQRQAVSAHWSLAGSTPLQRAAAFGQRMVRQYLRWYINPIVEQQNSANAAITNAVEALSRRDAAQRAAIAAARARRAANRPPPPAT